jgi:hypothetical protein
VKRSRNWPSKLLFAIYLRGTSLASTALSLFPREALNDKPVRVSQVLEDVLRSGQLLRRANDQGETRRGYLLASYVAAHARRARVIRELAVAGTLLVAAGIALPPQASAQTGSQGGAVGLFLFLAGGAHRDTSVSKQSPGVRASNEAKGKNTNVKQGPIPAKNGTRVVRVGDEATSVALAHDEKNARKDVGAVALRDDSHGNHR